MDLGSGIGQAAARELREGHDSMFRSRHVAFRLENLPHWHTATVLDLVLLPRSATELIPRLGTPPFAGHDRISLLKYASQPLLFRCLVLVTWQVRDLHDRRARQSRHCPGTGYAGEISFELDYLRRKRLG